MAQLKWLVLLLVFFSQIPTTVAQQFNCRWDGTSPFCSGVCAPGEAEVGRASNVSENNFSSTSNFGSACLIGSKARCCKVGTAEAAGGIVVSQACYLSGTAPFCDGECPVGWKDVGRQEANCWTGSKANCCPYPDDPRLRPPPPPRDCSFGPGTCKQGFVWREAFANDRVCVPADRRTQARQDNSNANLRRNPNGGAFGPDTCVEGFVWREATPSDHVCVTLIERARAKEDNTQAQARNACP